MSIFPNKSSRRTVIVDTAELLTREAQNALLKVAEEPPTSALLILIAKDPERLMPTVPSRFQKIYFSSVGESETAAWLQKEYAVAKTKAESAAKRAHGAPGLAHALLFGEQFQAMYGNAEKFLKTTSGARAAFVKDLIAAVPEDERFDIDGFLEALLIILSEMPREKHTTALHAILALRRDADYFNLNPRLQLTALAQVL